MEQANELMNNKQHRKRNLYKTKIRVLAFT